PLFLPIELQPIPGHNFSPWLEFRVPPVVRTCIMSNRESDERLAGFPTGKPSPTNESVPLALPGSRQKCRAFFPPKCCLSMLKFCGCSKPAQTRQLEQA